MNTPYERLKQILESQARLKPGVTFHLLDQTAQAMTDSQAAAALQQQRKALFKRFNEKTAA